MVAKVNLSFRYNSPLNEADRQVLRDAFDLCLNWYDGLESAMNKLSEDEWVSVPKILRELEDILLSETDTARPWHERARAFRDYCLRRVEEEKCRKALAAATNFAYAAGLDKYDFSQLMQKASEDFSEMRGRI